MQALKKQIKEKSLEGVYLFVGEETFVKETYLDICIKTILTDDEQAMNLDVFTADSKDIDKMSDAMDTLPFLAEKRVVVIRDRQLLKKKMDSKVVSIVEALGRLPESTILIISDIDFDKSGSIYKKVKKMGQIIEFNALDEAELIKVIARKLFKAGFEINVATGRYLIEYVGTDMSLLNQEIEKLISYKMGGTRIVREDVDACCTKSLENKIFELVDAIGRKNKNRALKLYHDMIVSKVQPMSILSMITRQFRINLLCMLLDQRNRTQKEIASAVKIPFFVVKKSLNLTRHFSEEKLKKSLDDCLKTEMAFKRGEMNQHIALELLIIEYCS